MPALDGLPAEGCREREEETCAVICVALHPDRAAVILDYALSYCQPQPASVIPGTPFGFGGEESVKNAIEVACGDSAAGVGDSGDHCARGLLRDRNSDLSIGGRVTESVLKEIGDNLFDTLRDNVQSDFLIGEHRQATSVVCVESGGESVQYLPDKLDVVDSLPLCFDVLGSRTG